MKGGVLLFFCYFLLIGAYAQSNYLDAYWNDGLKFQSKDSLYKFAVGGRVHYDMAISEQSSVFDELYEDVTTRVGVRRARLTFEGSMNKAFAYEFEFTFGETIEFADMYFAFFKVPFLERLTVGHFREPFGMEELTSSNSIVFMERSLTSVFGPSRNTGIMLQRQFLREKLRGYVALFRVTDDLGSDFATRGEHSFTNRWVLTPLSTQDNRVLHLGAAYNRVTPDGADYRVRSSNEVNSNPNYISTGTLKGVDEVQQLGGEVGYGNGRLTLQGEWMSSFTRFSNTDSASFKGIQQYKSFYVMASYFLKGGTRGYSRSGNRFSSINVNRAADGALTGAWEVGLRFSRLDVSETRRMVNTINNITAGVNWYYNSNTRLMLNYVDSRFNGGYEANTMQLRMQVTF